MNAVLHNLGLKRFVRNFPPNDTNSGIKTIEYAAFTETINAFYGRGMKGMLRRIGKASFRQGLHEQGAIMGVAGEALRLCPKEGVL